MPTKAVIKEEFIYENLPLSLEEIKENVIHPKVKKGKLILNRNNPKHRDFYED